jgi:hypothetical protein
MTNGYPKAPDLQELVARFGGYSKVPPEAWTEYDQAMAEWHRARRVYTAGHVIESTSQTTSRQSKQRRCRREAS